MLFVSQVAIFYVPSAPLEKQSKQVEGSRVTAATPLLLRRFGIAEAQRYKSESISAGEDFNVGQGEIHFNSFHSHELTSARTYLVKPFAVCRSTMDRLTLCQQCEKTSKASCKRVKEKQ